MTPFRSRKVTILLLAEKANDSFVSAMQKASPIPLRNSSGHLAGGRRPLLGAGQKPPLEGRPVVKGYRPAPLLRPRDSEPTAQIVYRR
ncbi:MAG: hypothetical protein ABIT76_15160 [Chthoniobacterales bacterium]